MPKHIVVTLGRKDYRYFFDLPSKIFIMCNITFMIRKKALEFSKTLHEEQA